MIKKIGLALLAASFAAGGQAADFSDGFESGLTGWTSSNAANVWIDQVSDPLAYVYTTPDASSYVATFLGESSLSRTVATAIGQQYTFSFWVLNTSELGLGQFQASFGGNSVLNQIDGFKIDSSFGLQDAWTKFSYDLTATSVATEIVLSAKPNEFAFMALDNVSVTAVTAVPEPGTLGMMLFGLAGLGVLSRRQKRAQR